MKIESKTGKNIVFYRNCGNYVIANKFISLDNNLSAEEFSIEISDISDQFKEMGYEFLYTDPPTFNPYLALFLLSSKSDSRIFANNIEIIRGTDSFNKYKKFLENVCINKELNCGRVKLDKVLKVPVYFSFPLNGEAGSIHRYMEYDSDGVVIDIVNVKPNHRNYKLTTKYFKEDLINKKIVIKGTGIQEYKNGNN